MEMDGLVLRMKAVAEQAGVVVEDVKARHEKLDTDKQSGQRGHAAEASSA